MHFVKKRPPKYARVESEKNRQIKIRLSFVRAGKTSERPFVIIIPIQSGKNIDFVVFILQSLFLKSMVIFNAAV